MFSATYIIHQMDNILALRFSARGAHKWCAGKRNKSKEAINRHSNSNMATSDKNMSASCRTKGDPTNHNVKGLL